jgi:deaminated glutathione amidase
MTKAAVIQMTSGSDVQSNLHIAHALLTLAAQHGAMLAALPENFALMGRHERDKLTLAETQTGSSLGDGVLQTWLHNTARELGLWIVAGTLPIKSDVDDRVVAACLVVNEQGVLQARYDKMHLFDVDVADATAQYRESSTIAAGIKPVCVDTPIGKLGLAICYDVRFPELFRLLNTQGAEVFVLPSAFTVPTGRAHWDVLLRARAIENLSYLLAPAQTGLHDNGRETWGHSMMVNHWGEVIAHRDTGPGMVIGDIDLPTLHTQRKKFPALRHRRM